jgi:hypothetical protein
MAISRVYYNIAYWIMIIVVVAFCLFLYFYLTSEAKQCVADPISYYQAVTNQMCYCNNGTGFFRW